jgi:multidrug resistance efflux pump
MKRQLTGILLVSLLGACKDKQEEIHPEYKELTAAVYASGSLVPEEEYKVFSSIDGYLVQSLVAEGDTVQKGQLLFSVSNEVRDVQEAGAAAMVQRTVPTVSSNSPAFNELKGRIEVGRIKMQQDSLQYLRYKNLYEQQAISKSNYEKFYLQYQSSLKDYNNLNQQYEQQRLSNNIQLQTVQNQLSLAAAQANVGKLKSFVNGRVYDIYKKDGDLITPNQPLALVGAGKMIAKLLVDEDDLDKIYTGQKVLITMDAYPDKIFNAHITKIYPLLNKVEQSFRVDAELDNTPSVEMYGLNLEANIIISEKKRVMVIPRSALLKGDSILLMKGEEVVKTKVKKGLEDEKWVEVIGLTEQSTIIIEQ